MTRAVLKGQLETLDQLIEAGGDIAELTELERWSYLHRALMTVTLPPTTTTIHYLLGKGLDVNASDYYGNTPLIYAARLKRADLIEVLLAAGADVGAVNHEGVSALRQLLLSHPFDYASMRVLLVAGADPLQTDEGGLSTREYAQVVANGDRELEAIFKL